MTENPSWQAEFPPEILYLDEHLAVAVKRVGEVCEEGSPHSISLRIRPAVEAALGRRVSRCECVHRLDRPVSGVCVLALTERAAAALSRCFSSRSVEKYYCACVEQAAAPVAEGCGWRRLECLMSFDRKRKMARIVPDAAVGKRAALEYTVLGRGERYGFLLVKTLTGRTHQIRCQLAGEHMPIKGDVKYGARRSERGGGIRLHGWKLELRHPFTGETLHLACLPPRMDSLWRSCMGLCIDRSGFCADNLGACIGAAPGQREEGYGQE